MKVFELLFFNKEMINRLRDVGFRLDDSKYMDLYSDYKRMRSGGDKVSYIVAWLSDKYSVSERKVYGLIRSMETDCTNGAV